MTENQPNAHLASKKGRNKGGGKLGNRNGVKGPRVGRKDKTTKPLPQPRPEAMAKLPTRRKREKTRGSGRDFPPGQNSHDGTVFQRGPDQIPRGNGNLMLRIIYNDKRQKLYDQICALIDESPRSAFVFHQEYMDRTEGRPGRKGNPLTPHRSKFVLTTKDGQEIEMLPSRDDERVKAAAAVPVTGEDAMILGLPSTSLVRV